VDSRRLAPGQAFVALKTGKRDGHDFLNDALKAGASAAIVAKADSRVALAQLVVPDPLAALQSIAREHRRMFHGTVIGITGSAGKTSTKELLSILLGGEAGGALATEGNLNNQIGVALSLCRLDPVRHRFAVIEAGISEKGEMESLARMIEPGMALVTLVAPAHLADLGSLETVAEEKSVLATHVRTGGVSIFPSSCEEFAPFRDFPASKRLVVEPVPVLGDGEAPKGRVPFVVSHSGERTSVTLALGAERHAFTLRRVTDGMAQNAVIAVCAALRLGVRTAEIQRRLSLWTPSRLRGEWRTSDGQRVYLDCYNANPASMADALGVFYAIAPAEEPRLLVIGCMEELGKDSARYHVELGRSLKLRQGDQLVAIGGQADAIRRGAIEGGAAADQVTVSDTVSPVAARLSLFRGSVFVKGSRRHELEKAFAGREFAESAHA
jgi:UDP-N-acetylmuramoyl-tripeptide--D-alanyl-D-alanine ligase